MPGGSFDVVIIGAGFSGCYALHRLRADGFSVRLVESSSGLGGVWQNNRYPGARVDSHVPNYEYSLPQVWKDWTWSERFPGREELLRYFEHVDDVLDLSRDIDLDTRVTSARFDSDTARWQLSTAADVEYDARFVIMCTGFGSKPYTPDLAGLDDFGGICHHTARWPEEGVELAGKRVGVLGTGASGVQVVQEAAKEAAHLVVFQRTPVTALPMMQRRLDPDEQNAAKPDYPEIFRRRNEPPGTFDDIRRFDIGALEVSDERRREVFEAAWAKGGFHFWAGTFNDILSNEEANRTAYEFWRDKVRQRVGDPRTAQALAPTDPPYPFGTKRPSLEQDYYDVFNQPNVELVDLRATPLESITSTGVRTTGAGSASDTRAGVGEYDLDVLVLATGFDANTGGLTSIDLRATDGRTIAEHWADGVDTHMGLAVPGFPNLLMMYGPQSTTAFCNGPVCAEIQGDWISDLLGHMRGGSHRMFDADGDAAREWSEMLDMVADATLFGRTDSWYMGANIPGKRRQLLNLPMTDVYLDRLADNAATDYPGLHIA